MKRVSHIIYQGSDSILEENNFESFKSSTAANLSLLNGFLASDPENENLLTLLIKGHTAFAFGHYETIALKEILLEEESENINLAIQEYEKAIGFGFRYLSSKGISKSEFLDKNFPEKLTKVFDTKLDREDYIAIFYFGQALGSSINLQRANLDKVSYLAHAKNTIEWVCSKDETIERGICGQFRAVLMASTPSLLGGDPERAKELFKKEMKLRPYDLLTQVSYIQFYTVPMIDDDEFGKYMRSLEKKISEWRRVQRGNLDPSKTIYYGHEDFNLYNTIASKRYRYLKQLKKEIF